jgi:hypothetical protein
MSRFPRTREDISEREVIVALLAYHERTTEAPPVARARSSSLREWATARAAGAERAISAGRNSQGFRAGHDGG